MKPMEEAELGYTPYKQPPRTILRVNRCDAVGLAFLILDDGTRVKVNTQELLTQLGYPPLLTVDPETGKVDVVR